MSGILEYLPLLRGYKPSFDTKANMTLTPAGSTSTLRIPPEEKWQKPGWIKCVLATVNNPYTIAEHNVFEKPTVTTPYALYLLGNWRPPPHGGTWLDRYDMVNNLYTVCFAPIPPQDFKSGTQIILKHPVNDPFGNPIGNIAVHLTWWNVVLIDDIEEFRKSVQELFGRPKILGGI